jgi:predicted RNase H-like nuclease (RuvC/YqgF family)
MPSCCQAIEKVRKENERLKEQVESETRSRSDNSAVQSHVLRLADQVQTYKNKIEIEQRRLEELDKQHKIMQVRPRCALARFSHTVQRDNARKDTRSRPFRSNA